MILPNGTVVRLKRELRWLGVQLDRKLNFKGYIQKKIASATSAIYILLRLLRSEWGLSATSGRQLYIACVISIYNYGAEIQFKNQKQYIEQFQKLQNKAIRKVLGVFRTSPISPMEIKANLAPLELRIRQKIKRYAFRITQMDPDHPLRKRTPITYTPEYHTGVDPEALGPKWQDWNQKETKTRKFPTQLVRILASVSEILEFNSPALMQ